MIWWKKLGRVVWTTAPTGIIGNSEEVDEVTEEESDSEEYGSDSEKDEEGHEAVDKENDGERGRR